MICFSQPVPNLQRLTVVIVGKAKAQAKEKWLKKKKTFIYHYQFHGFRDITFACRLLPVGHQVIVVLFKTI